MTLRTRYLRLNLGVVGLVALLAFQAAASGAAGKRNTFVLSGQTTGTLTLDIAQTCVTGNIQKSAGIYNIRLYLTDHGAKPTTAKWYLLIGAKGTGTIHYPAPYPAQVTLSANKGASTIVAWTAANKSGAGAVTLNAGAKSGAINLRLPPAAGQPGARRAEKIVGNWSCD